jgi:hypothetical protein
MDKPRGSAFSRNLFPIIIVRKIITSLILVLGFTKPRGQILGLSLIYMAFFVYVCAVRPLKTKVSNIAYILVETIMVVIHIVFIFMSDQSDPTDEVNYAKALLILVFIILMSYVLFSIIALFIFLRGVLNP